MKPSSQNAVVGLYRHESKGRHDPGRSVLVEKIDLDKPLRELTRSGKWKSQLLEMLQKRGVHVISVSLVHDHDDPEINIVASISVLPARFGDHRRVATVGGRSVSDGPDLSKKTMAGKRRAARG